MAPGLKQISDLTPKTRHNKPINLQTLKKASQTRFKTEFVKVTYVPGTTAFIHKPVFKEGNCEVVRSCPLSWTSEARAAIHPSFRFISCISVANLHVAVLQYESLSTMKEQMS